MADNGETDELIIAIRWAFRERHYVLRTHAFIEMRMDSLLAEDVRRAGMDCELLEDYPDRPQGHTVLLLGLVGPERAIHLVVGCAAFEKDWSEPLVVVTVYRPEPPAWADERTRGRKSR
ncbi:MAG: DUF4258 domain-containing protein [Actinomycetota bacterium]